jgi:hypothetical protein
MSHRDGEADQLCHYGLPVLPPLPRPRCPRPWVTDAGMYEPFYLAFDAYPTVVPRVKVRGLMALFLAVSILWALVW